MDVFTDKIAPLIQEKRASGISDAQMEREMGLPSHSINKWFTLKYKSYNKYFYQLSIYFGVPISHFCENEKPAHNNVDGLTDAQKEWLQVIDGMDDKQINKLLGLIKTVMEMNI